MEESWMEQKYREQLKNNEEVGICLEVETKDGPFEEQREVLGVRWTAFPTLQYARPYDNQGM